MSLLPAPRYTTSGLGAYLASVPLPLPLPPGDASGWTCALVQLGTRIDDCPRIAHVPAPWRCT